MQRKIKFLQCVGCTYQANKADSDFQGQELQSCYPRSFEGRIWIRYNRLKWYNVLKCIKNKTGVCSRESVSPLRRFTCGAFKRVVVLRCLFFSDRSSRSSVLLWWKRRFPLNQQQQHPFKHPCYSGQITTTSSPDWPLLTGMSSSSNSEDLRTDARGDLSVVFFRAWLEGSGAAMDEGRRRQIKFW